MLDILSDAQIALLRNIGGHDPSKLSPEQRRALDWLIVEGYVEAVEDDPTSRLQLGSKGAEFLSIRADAMKAR